MAGAVSLAACDRAPRAPQPPPPDPLNPFYQDTAALLARYQATIAAQPGLADRLGTIRDAHRAHLQALAREIGPGLSASPNPSAAAGAPASLAALSAAEKDGAAAATAACLHAPSYRAALLGSIAAARASHAVVLS
jgi:hypothetical protein